MAITAVNLNGGTVTDNSSHSGADLSGAVASFGGLQVNTGWGLFNAAGQGGNYGLWATDGVGADTRELNPAGVDPSALAPHEITALGNRAVFEGTDSQGHRGLWVTDVTSAGTVELTATDVNPQHIYAYGNYVVFEGTGAGNIPTLWVSDGTAGGTHEVSVGGAYSAGIFANATVAPPDFTGIGNVVLFNGESEGQDQAQTVQGLWAFNGTTATLLDPISGSSYGIAPGFDPQHMFVFGREVLFLAEGTRGVGDAFIPDLWVTNGTGGWTLDINTT